MMYPKKIRKCFLFHKCLCSWKSFQQSRDPINLLPVSDRLCQIQQVQPSKWILHQQKPQLGRILKNPVCIMVYSFIIRKIKEMWLTVTILFFKQHVKLRSAQISPLVWRYSRFCLLVQTQRAICSFFCYSSCANDTCTLWFNGNSLKVVTFSVLTQIEF